MYYYSLLLFGISSFFITMTLFGIRAPFSIYVPFICLLDFPFFLKIIERLRLHLTHVSYVALFFSYVLFNALFHSLSIAIISLIIITLLKLLILIYLFFYFTDRIRKFGLHFFYAGLFVHFLYVCYQQISYAFFGASLPFSTPLDLPFVIHDGGFTVADSNFGGTESFIISTIFRVRVSGFTQEPSYLIAVSFPLLLTRISKFFKYILIFFIVEALAKNALLIIGLFSSYFILSRFLKDLHAFLITLLGTIAILSLTSYWTISLGATYLSRFSPFYHYIYQANFMEKIFGVGMYNYAMTYGTGLVNEMTPPMGAFGGILIELGLIGFLFYMVAIVYIFNSAQNKYLFICIIGLLFSWGYFTAWPIWPFALAMDRALPFSPKIPKRIKNNVVYSSLAQRA